MGTAFPSSPIFSTDTDPQLIFMIFGEAIAPIKGTKASRLRLNTIKLPNSVERDIIEWNATGSVLGYLIKLNKKGRDIAPLCTFPVYKLAPSYLIHTRRREIEIYTNIQSHILK